MNYGGGEVREEELSPPLTNSREGHESLDQHFSSWAEGTGSPYEETKANL